MTREQIANWVTSGESETLALAQIGLCNAAGDNERFTVIGRNRLNSLGRSCIDFASLRSTRSDPGVCIKLPITFATAPAPPRR